MNFSTSVKSGGFGAQSMRELRGNRFGVTAVLFTVLVFIAGCSDNVKTATPTPVFTPAAGSYTATQYVTVSDTNQNAVLYCTNDGSTPTTSSTQCANPVTVSQSQTLKAIAIAPGAGPSDVATASYTISTSVSAPTVTGIGPANGVAAGGTSVTITGTGFTNPASVRFGTTAATSVVVNSATSITAVSPAGSGTVHVTVVTSAGTSNTSSVDLFAYAAVPAPVVTGVSTSSGPAAGGTSVTITGTNFTGATSVVFGTVAATSFTVKSATSITAVSPVGAGTVHLTVVTPTGTSSASAADQFTYVSAPAVTGIVPSSGPAGGGTSVTITGSNFTGATAVNFGAVAATGVTVNSATGISAVSPAGSGTVDVTVSTLGGTSATSIVDQFTYLSAPTVTGTSPSRGPTTGGTIVTISGTGFSGTPTVNFGAAAATNVVVNSATSITAVSPAGSGTVDVKVLTQQGSSVISTADQFTYYSVASPPAVTAISPTSGPAAGSTPVTITGNNFTSDSSVYFGSIAGTGVTVNSPTSISVTSPAGSSTVDVTVVTSGGTSNTSSADQFTYTPPTISGVVVSGPTGSGTAIKNASVQLYAAGTSGYGAGPTVIGQAITTDTTGKFSGISYDCSKLTEPGDQLYLVATGGNAGVGTNTQITLMTALGSCSNIASSFPNGVTVNEATTIASAYALSGFANVDTSYGGIDVGAPATFHSLSAPKCDESNGWQSTGASTCNYIGLQNAFAAVDNLVDIPTGQVLAVTPAYCTSKPCITAAATTPYYKTSIVPQGRINALANALASCVGTQSSASNPSTKCSALFTATSITTASTVVTVPSGTTITPADTLQAALNIAHCPGEKTVTSCGVDVQSASGIYSLVAATPPYMPTLTLTTATNAGITTDLSLAIIYQGGGLGGGSGTTGAPEATGLAIDGSGNVWVPTMSSAGGSLAVFNNLGAPITTSGTSDSAYGGYTTGVHNPQAIAIDPTSGTGGNPWIAWVGNAPSGTTHGLGATGSLTQVQLNSTTLALSTPSLFSGLTNTALLTPAPYGVAMDSNGNPWLSSYPGGTSNGSCGGGTYGGSILGFDKNTGVVLNPGTNGGPDGYLSYADNSSCPSAIAFDGSGYLWTYDNATTGSDSAHRGQLQLNTPTSSGTAGTVAGGPYHSDLQYLSAVSIGDLPIPLWNQAIDGSGNSWGANADGIYMDVIPNLSLATAGALSGGTWGAGLATAANVLNIAPQSATAIDGEGNAWAAGHGGLWAYSSANATLNFATYSGDAVMLSPTSGSIPGFEPTDPTANASGRTGGTYAFGGGYPVDGGGLNGLFGSATFVSPAVDSSGNLWVSGSALGYTVNANQGSQLTEFVGIVTPVVAPLTPSSLGRRP